MPRPRPPTTRWAPHTRRRARAVGQEVRFARNPWCRVVGVPRYRLAMPPSYLRHPHLHGDTLVLVAEDDVWTAPVDGGRAYRLTADGVPVARPRISPDGALVAWTSTRERAPEVFVTEVDGGAARRLTWWGDHTTKLIGWTPEGEVLAVSAAGQPSRRQPWAHAIPATGGTPRRLPLGPLADLAQRAEGPAVLLSATMTREMAWQKRYRGGTAGKLWWNPRGRRSSASPPTSTATSTRRCWSATASRSSPTTRAGATSTPSRPTAPTCAATPTTAPTARPRSTPGTPPPTAPASSTSRPGSSGCSTTSTASPGSLDVRLGGPRTAREPYRITTGEWLGRVRPDATGRSSVVGVRGTVHRLTHRDGPARALAGHPRRAGPARRAAGRGPRGVGRRRARRGRRVHRPARPARPRRAADAAVRRVRPRAGARARARRQERRPHHPRRAAAPARPIGEFRELARGGDGEVYDVAFSPDSAWLAYCDPVGSGLSQVVLVRLADGEAVPVTEGRFRDADPVFTARRQAPGVPLAAQLRPDLRRARLRPHVPRLLAAVPGAARRAHAVAVRGEPGRAPGLARGRQAGGPARARPVRPRRRDRGSAQREEDEEGRRPARGGRRHRGARRPGGAGPGRRGPLPRHARGQGLPALVPPPDQRHARRRPRGHRREAREAGAGALRPGPPQARRDRRAGEQLRGERRRHPARRARRRHAAGAAHRPVRASAPTDGPVDAGADEYPVDTRRVVVTVDPTAEWRQMFDEAARLMRDHFWVADMAGVDWAASSPATGRWSTPSAATTTSSTCCGSCRASWAPRTPT